MSEAITPEDVDSILEQHLLPPRTFSCPLEKCAGRFLMKPVQTDRPQPPFDRIMMDGYAVRSANSPGPFEVLGLLRAGEPAPPLPTDRAVAWEVCTGGVLPEGADVAVPYEQTRREGQQLFLSAEADLTPGGFVHDKGSDQAAGQTILHTGARLGSREIAAAASFGAASLQVRQLPRIGILSTGDELVDPAATPEPYQIRRSNDLAIDTALALNQFHARTRTALPDDPVSLREQLRTLIPSHDVLICSGGISKGAHDHLPEILEALGCTAHLRRVRQKPGQPMAFWTSEDCTLFTLPGNPMSVLCGLHRFVLPYLRACMGQTDAFSAPESRQLETSPPQAPLTLYLPVRLTAAGTALAIPLQNSGDLIRPLESDGFLAIPPHAEGHMFPFYPWY